MKNTQKNAANKYCDNCNFKCSKLSDWVRHIATPKHKNRTKLNILEPKNAGNIFECKNCTKKYTARYSLWYHEQKCKGADNKKAPQLTELIMKMVEQNQELTKQIVELSKNNSTSIQHNTHTNSHNKTFNLQFFLNEECKDAMNMSEFINSLQLQISDLEAVGKLGYVEGISNIIIKQLSDTDMYKRPLHCSDIKRETLYIKEEDRWEKEGPENTKMRKIIKTVENKNIGLITEWTGQHPCYRESASLDNDTYLKLLAESMSGNDEHVNKVIKNISKEVAIEK